ncbi:MAG: hypothetical protein PHZ14_08695 [Sulfuricella sp.]|nr:hypothetical protein [Sulfuricella sp.]
MLSLFLSTIAFFLAAFFINRYLDAQGLERNMSRKILVGTLATVISIGAAWATDKLDGDADASQKNVSLTDIMQGGDPTQALKVLSGLK